MVLVLVTVGVGVVLRVLVVVGVGVGVCGASIGLQSRGLSTVTEKSPSYRASPLVIFTSSIYPLK
jgi:hypothetical protein